MDDDIRDAPWSGVTTAVGAFGPYQFVLPEDGACSSDDSAGFDESHEGRQATETKRRFKLYISQAQRPEQQASNQVSTTAPGENDNERELARAAWQSRFGERHVSIPRESPDLFITGRRLGGGGVGIVHETHLDGIPLALKRTYCRKLTEDQLNEIKVLGKISEQRHRHIVELVGSYVHRQRSAYELGLLIWPVAHCDLATLLHDLWHVADCCLLDPIRYTALDDPDTDLVSALETLSRLLGIESTEMSATFAKDVIEGTNSRLTKSIGCIAEAVAFIHGQGIRHKDLKPSQILFSPHGLWLTDFGWSKDMSEFSHSNTSGFDRVTAKYQAPERANNQPCGRSEDIFALGCMFMEMSAVFLYPSPVHSSKHIWHPKGWSYQSNLRTVQYTLYHPLQVYRTNLEMYGPECRLLGALAGMLQGHPCSRPTISQVLQALSGPPKASFGGFFSPCCGRQRPTILTCHSQCSIEGVQRSQTQALSNFIGNCQQTRIGSDTLMKIQYESHDHPATWGQNGRPRVSQPPRSAPVINPHPRSVPGMPHPMAAAPTRGFAWAFPGDRPTNLEGLQGI